jgi:hypothetical protein
VALYEEERITIGIDGEWGWGGRGLGGSGSGLICTSHYVWVCCVMGVKSGRGAYEASPYMLATCVLWGHLICLTPPVLQTVVAYDRLVGG